eukprot:382258-Alexandrium_andersonii.AAC.1
MRSSVCACVRACVRACLRAFVRARVRACVRAIPRRKSWRDLSAAFVIDAMDTVLRRGTPTERRRCRHCWGKAVRYFAVSSTPQGRELHPARASIAPSSSERPAPKH